MDMKIGAITPAGKTAAIGKYSASQRNTRLNVPVQEMDKVDITESSKLFARALSAAKETSELRAGLVAQTKQSISSGTYQINSRQIAEKMLSDLR